MNRFTSKTKQIGFTLVEIAIVVAIGALLLIAISQAPRIIASNKSNAEISELPQVVTSIQKIYANRSNYAGATLADVVALNGLPEDRVAGAAGVNRWGGAITMAPATLNSANDVIDLTYAAVPSLECTQLVPAVENRFLSVTVGGTEVKPGGVLNLATVGAQCASANAVTIVYRFAK